MEHENKKLRIYLDASLIIDFSKADNIEQSEIDAIQIITEKIPQLLYTSEETKKEIEKHENPKKKGLLLISYNLYAKIPEENIIKSEPALFNNIMFNEATFNGSVNREDFLFTKLKTFFDENDAKHIFQAEKNNLDYFLTLDRKTILKRIGEKSKEFGDLKLKIKFVSPTQLINKLKLN